MNINTKEYWESRFKSGNWNQNGKRQTREYALANIQHLKIGDNFKGSILDFGCALGDAIPFYKSKYPYARIYGFDISLSAIDYCKKEYSELAEFFSGDLDNVPESEVIIASHVMEHITNDKDLIKKLLLKCNELYVFVPYKEYPLYHEHVNFYDENYYKDLEPEIYKIFKVSYKFRNSVGTILRQVLRFRLLFYTEIRKDIIMFHFWKKI